MTDTQYDQHADLSSAVDMDAQRDIYKAAFDLLYDLVMDGGARYESSTDLEAKTRDIRRDVLARIELTKTAVPHLGHHQISETAAAREAAVVLQNAMSQLRSIMVMLRHRSIAATEVEAHLQVLLRVAEDDMGRVDNRQRERATFGSPSTERPL